MVSSNPMVGRPESAPADPAPDLEGSPAEVDQVLEVLGTVPVWVLGGMRLERLGERQMPNGWVVGVYQMDIAEFDSEESSHTN